MSRNLPRGLPSRALSLTCMRRSRGIDFMTPSERYRLRITRRSLLGRAATGIGSLALASLLNPKLLAGQAKATVERWPGVVNPLHFPAKAKRVINLYMAGGPSHLETF